METALIASTIFLGAASSAASAAQQNAAARAAAKTASQRGAAMAASGAIQMQQIRQAAAQQRAERLDEAHRLRSRIRVAAGESGIGYGGTYEAMMRQVDFDAAAAAGSITRNESWALRRAQFGLSADLAPLREPYQMQPIALAGFTGGLSGAISGLRISRALDLPTGGTSKVKGAKP